MYSLRITEKQRHANRKNLNKHILASTDESVTIVGTHDDIVNKFGQILTKESKYIIVLKGVAYRIIFGESSAKIYTKPYNPDEPTVS